MNGGIRGQWVLLTRELDATKPASASSTLLYSFSFVNIEFQIRVESVDPVFSYSLEALLKSITIKHRLGSKVQVDFKTAFIAK